jgi:hypothetical protein
LRCPPEITAELNLKIASLIRVKQAASTFAT